jgi:nitrate reductase / nitrite oxidoreductase, beta subunit
MEVRSQLSMVFHLDKCLGCHTCSVACKNVWTDRRGAEYMWWNNVETKPGTGYPTRWEDQQAYQGGWDRRNGRLRLKSTSRTRIVANIFHHPHMPTMDDYYEPWTYDYGELFGAAAQDDQPTARARSLVTGQPMDPEAGPNWDDDLGGSPVYAANDPNLEALDARTREQLFAIERLVFFHLPRICNHCLNPACVAACPSGAIYKRGEDGIVVVDQNRCRGWRACVPACPYKKVFYNWASGKSEKCILCFPRIEAGQPPACFHACVGRIRYVGVLLYDASRIAEAAGADPERLVEAHRSLILDPCDPDVIAAARRSGLPDAIVSAAQQSPVYQFVKVWKLALPAHLEFRTLPMLFYVPPLSPILSVARNAGFENVAEGFFDHGDAARVPVRYLAALLAGGDESSVRYALRKQQAVRWHRRAATAGDVDADLVQRRLAEADCRPEQAEAIYRLTSLSSAAERFVLPPASREEAIEATEHPLAVKQRTGFGFVAGPRKD